MHKTGRKFSEFTSRKYSTLLGVYGTLGEGLVRHDHGADQSFLRSLVICHVCRMLLSSPDRLPSGYPRLGRSTARQVFLVVLKRFPVTWVARADVLVHILLWLDSLILLGSLGPDNHSLLLAVRCGNSTLSRSVTKIWNLKFGYSCSSIHSSIFDVTVLIA